MSELAPELLSLLTLVVAALTALVEKVRRDLKSNTLLTQETKTAANGTLTDALAKLAAERNRVFALRMLLQERNDRVAFIVARHPEVETTLQQYKQLHSSRPTEADELAAEQRLLIEAATPDDPTGTDAFAHPGC